MACLTFEKGVNVVTSSAVEIYADSAAAPAPNAAFNFQRDLQSWGRALPRHMRFNRIVGRGNAAALATTGGGSFQAAVAATSPAGGPQTTCILGGRCRFSPGGMVDPECAGKLLVLPPHGEWHGAVNCAGNATQGELMVIRPWANAGIRASEWSLKTYTQAQAHATPLNIYVCFDPIVQVSCMACAGH